MYNTQVCYGVNSRVWYERGINYQWDFWE